LQSGFGLYRQAIAKYKKVIEINPNHASAYYSLACIYSRKNETVQAIEWLRKAIVLDKSFIDKSKAESAFDNIRESPEFQQLINSQ